jgi:hypothetical protein
MIIYTFRALSLPRICQLQSTSQRGCYATKESEQNRLKDMRTDIVALAGDLSPPIGRADVSKIPVNVVANERIGEFVSIAGDMFKGLDEMNSESRTIASVTGVVTGDNACGNPGGVFISLGDFDVLGSMVGGGFFLKLKFIRLALFARLGNGFGSFFDEPDSMEVTAFGIMAARAKLPSLCFVAIPLVGTFFTGWNVTSLADNEGWLDREATFVAGSLEDFCSEAGIDCGCGGCLERAMLGDGGIEDAALDSPWICYVSVG